jgi:hypothetical protein
MGPPGQDGEDGDASALGALNTKPASAGSGTVTTISVVTANGVSGSVANPTSTPAITVALAAITPTTVTPSGLVDLSGAAAGQIKFPASQNASSDVNTLDDYEEGTWTPVIGGNGGTSGQSYSIQLGKYIKIGQVVYFTCYVLLSAKGTITSYVVIQGLPFTSAASYLYAIATTNYTLGTNWAMLGGQMSPNVTFFIPIGIQAFTTTPSVITTADIINTSAFVCSGFYTTT